MQDFQTLVDQTGRAVVIVPAEYLEKLAAELIAASNNEGPAIKKRDDTLKMAESNKAFSHFRY